jgi:hypothetical protein
VASEKVSRRILGVALLSAAALTASGTASGARLIANGRTDAVESCPNPYLTGPAVWTGTVSKLDAGGFQVETRCGQHVDVVVAHSTRFTTSNGGHAARTWLVARNTRVIVSGFARRATMQAVGVEILADQCSGRHCRSSLIP